MVSRSKMTIDYALEAFKHSPSDKTAGDLLTVSMTYNHDDMIGDEEHDDNIILVRDWLLRAKA